MSLALSDKTIDAYFGFLTKLDTESKKKLIVKLTESIDLSEKKSTDFQMIVGA